jgi:orotate phosphoribosyltransferase/outer membrane protein assembly factor BamB
MTTSVTNRDLVRHALLDRGLKLGSGVDGRGHPLAWSLDCRELTLDGSLLPAIADLLWPALEIHMPALIAGPTVSAAPLVGALLLMAAREGKAASGALVRRTAKTYGLRKLIEGPPFPRGQRAVIVDDILAHGSSIVHTCRALRSAGAVPVAAVTLVDLEVPSAVTIDNLPYTSLFSASELGLAAPAQPSRTTPGVTFRELSLSVSPGPTRFEAALPRGALVVLDAAGVLVADRSSGASNMTWVACPPQDAVCLSVRGTEVLTVSRSGLISALDLAARKMKWTSRLDVPVRAAAMAVWRDHVVVASTRDHESLDLTSLSLDGGGSKTHRRLTGCGTPLEVIASDANAIVATTGAVYSFRPDLALQWGRRWTVQSNVVPSPEKDAVYLLADNTLLALDVADGATRWARPVLGRKSPQISASDAGVMLASEITTAAFGSSGSVKWVRSLGARITAGPTAVGPDIVAVGDRGGGLHLLRASDGTFVFSRALDDRIFTSIIADAELLVLLDPRAGLMCLSLNNLLETAQAVRER